MKQTVLLVKTSSLGDILHLLPALSDAQQHFPDLVFHWVVEESFAEVASWHPSVEKVIPIALRRWRRKPWHTLWSGELPRFVRTLRAQPYAQIIDAQGLIKSALIAKLARGWCIGFDRDSARESLAAQCYQRSIRIDRNNHALNRLRQLFASALHYPQPQSPPDYGLNSLFSAEERAKEPRDFQASKPYWVFLHGTTWPSKHWPESYWLALAKLCAPYGRMILPWSNAQEKARAQRMADVAPKQISLTEKINLTQLATILARAKTVVAVDTGPAHLAAALGIPVIGLYGPTDPQYTGTLAQKQQHLQGTCQRAANTSASYATSADTLSMPPCRKRVCPLEKRSSIHPPCFHALTPERVWQILRAQT